MHSILDCAAAQQVFEGLFHPPAVAVLRWVDSLMLGHLRYVISSSWRLQLTRAQLRYVLRQAGLGIVADAIEDGAGWATPLTSFNSQNRYLEVVHWLRDRHAGEPYVILDDEVSGGSLAESSAEVEAIRHRIIICKEAVGLVPAHVEQIVAALSEAGPKR